MIRAFDDGLPMLLGYQQRWQDEQAEIAICEKSRRIGLSWGDAVERAIYAGTEGGGNVTYMSYNLEMTETYIGDVADHARAFDYAASEVISETFFVSRDEQVQRFRVNFDRGKHVLALASNPRVLRSRGKPGDVAIIDEAAFCPDLDALLTAATAITTWGGKVRVISTHNGDTNPFNQLVNDARTGRLPDCPVHTITLDDALADGLARRICSVKGDRWHPDYAAQWREKARRKYRDRDEMMEELYCAPRHGAGAWLSGVLVESRMQPAPVRRFAGDAAFNARPEPVRRREVEEWLEAEVAHLLAALPVRRRHVMGMDFARSGHLSVIAPLTIEETLIRRSPFLIEIHNVPHRQQSQMVAFVCDRLPRFSGAALDATGPGSFVAEDAEDRYGPMAEPVTLSLPWYRDHMPPYKAALEDRMLILPKHDDVLDDHRAFRLIDGVPRLPPVTSGDGKGKGKQKGVVRHGDAAMALILAHYASRKDAAGPPSYIPVRRGRPGPDDDGDEWDDDETGAGWSAFAGDRGGMWG